MTVNEFVQNNNQYVNHYGKISPYIYATKKYSHELETLLISDDTFKLKIVKLINILHNAFNIFQDEARQLKVPSKQFDYVAPKSIIKLEMHILSKRNIKSAIHTLYSACLCGEKLSVI